MESYHAKRRKKLKASGLTDRKTPYKRVPNGDRPQSDGKTYFTGIPCKRGHIARRRLYNSVCVECEKINRDLYRKKEDKNRRKSLVLARYKKTPWMFAHYNAKARAKRSNIQFDITQDDIKKAWPQDGRCPATGIKLRTERGNGHIGFDSATVDRIIPNLGYIRGNIAILSAAANRIKGNTEDPEMIIAVGKWMKKMLKGVF